MKQRKLKDKKTKRLNVILPASLYDAITATAEEEQKSKGMLVEEIVGYWLAEREIAAKYFS